MRRDAFGLQRQYYAGEWYASTIRELLGEDRSLDRAAVDAFLRGEPMVDRTMFAAVRQVPPTGPGAPDDESVATRLRAAVGNAIATAQRPTAVALSGGLDSAVVLALARELDSTVGAIVFDPEIPGYGETDAAERTAQELRVDCVRLRAGEPFVRPVREAIAAFETPLYNLHPLSKWWLAAIAKKVGYASVISGDGADQVFRHDTSADYLPLVGAAFDAHAIALHTPFLDIGCVARDPDKRALRELAATLPIRAELVHGPKVSRLAPPLPFDAPIDRLGEMLSRPVPDLSNDRDRCRWGTLALLVDSFGARP